MSWRRDSKPSPDALYEYNCTYPRYDKSHSATRQTKKFSYLSNCSPASSFTPLSRISLIGVPQHINTSLFVLLFNDAFWFAGVTGRSIKSSDPQLHTHSSPKKTDVRAVWACQVSV